MKKIISLLLVLCLTVLCLAGCSQSQLEDIPEDEVAAAEAEAEAEAEAAAPINRFSADTVVLTVNGSPVTWEEYFYYLNNYRVSMESSFGAITDWNAYNAYYTTNTNDEVVRSLTLDAVVPYHLLLVDAEARGLSVSAEEVEAQLQTVIDSVVGNGDGGVSEEETAAFEQELAAMGVSVAFETSLVQQQMTELAMFDAITADATEKDLSAWLNEVGIMSAKHILILTVDSSTREALSEEQISEARKLADDLCLQLWAAYDADAEDKSEFLALFDELMNTYSEDTGLATNPDGYIFEPGQMVASFEEGTKALSADYGLSAVVESDYGYHIILRQPIAADTVLGTNSYGEEVTAMDLYKNNLFYNDYITALYETVELVWAEGFEELTAAEIFS